MKRRVALHLQLAQLVFSNSTNWKVSGSLNNNFIKLKQLAQCCFLLYSKASWIYLRAARVYDKVYQDASMFNIDFNFFSFVQQFLIITVSFFNIDWHNYKGIDNVSPQTRRHLESAYHLKSLGLFLLFALILFTTLILKSLSSSHYERWGFFKYWIVFLTFCLHQAS